MLDLDQRTLKDITKKAPLLPHRFLELKYNSSGTKRNKRLLKASMNKEQLVESIVLNFKFRENHGQIRKLKN